MIPSDIRLPDRVTAADLVVSRRGSTIWRVALDTGRVVALKYATDNCEVQGLPADTARRLAAREAAVLAALDIRDRLYASGETSQGTWLATMWLEDPSLQRCWRPMRTEDGQRARQSAHWATSTAAGALADLHQRGWRHGDIQAAHILVPDHGPGRLIDFALAQGPVDVAPTLVYRGALAHVTAPEIAAEILDTPADHHIHIMAEAEIYSLGAALYAAWTGRWPRDYGTGDLGRLALGHIYASICDPSTRRPMPDGWPLMASLIAAMLSHNPGERPTAADIHESLTETAGSR